MSATSFRSVKFDETLVLSRLGRIKMLDPLSKIKITLNPVSVLYVTLLFMHNKDVSLNYFKSKVHRCKPS